MVLVKVMRININKLECKCTNFHICSVHCISININKLECKLFLLYVICIFYTVLI